MDVEFLRNKYEDSYDGVVTKSKFKIGIRHLQMVYMFLCTLIMGMMRSSNVIAVLAISDFTRNNETYIQIHNWDSRIQGTIFSSFFFGYALIYLPAEIYLKQVGDKFVLTSVLLINGGLSAAMPTVVNKGGWIAVCNAEFLMGMTQACLLPINEQLICNWLPPSERRIFGPIIQGAILLGTVIAFPISGYLFQTRLGWELIFYSQAMMTLSMAAIWALLTAGSPGSHQAIGNEEKDFIRQALSTYRKKKQINPWRQILRTKTFWALALSHSAASAIFIFFVVEVPAFLLILNSSLRTSSSLASLPLICMWSIHVLSAQTLDFIFNIGLAGFLFHVKHFRKIVNSIATFGIVIGLMTLPNLIASWNQLGLFVLMGTLGLLGLQFSGFLENHRDMTQNFSGTLLTMTSAVSNVIAALIPLISGFIISDNMVSKHQDYNIIVIF
ncbi:unnamed protein product, partial [Brenthis ino]